MRADFDDGWILVRPSGTEPKLRVTVEAVDDAGMARLRGVVEKAAPTR